MPPSTPPSEPRRTVIRRLPQDAAAVARLLAHTTIEHERPGSAEDRYLDHLIGKPWGFEFRVYDDARVDVWMLHLAAGTRTSLHCHPGKDTCLLCVAGRGRLTTGDARSHPIAPGSVVHIERGAAHRTSAKTDMVLVEVEMPRDKYDLVRLEDDNGRAARKYEHAGYVTRRLAALEELVAGPPAARLRPECPTGRHRFALERGANVARRPDGLAFAIALDRPSVLWRDIAIAAIDGLDAAEPDQSYLTIRSTHQEDSP